MSADLFASLGGDYVDPRVVVEVALPLELSGEAVRGRICVFTDEDGNEWALRPDLTLPVAVDEVTRRRGGEAGEKLVRYSAPVFRLPALPGEPVEFTQAGFERFGAVSDAKADAAVFATIAEICSANGVRSGLVKFGDLNIFPAFIDAMDLPPETASGLKRAFRQQGGVRAFLNTDRSGAASGLSQRLQGMSRDEVAAFVGDIFALTGINPVGERSSDEIVERLHQRAQSGDTNTIPSDAKDLLETVLNVDVPTNEAGDSLHKIAKQAGLNGLDAVIARLDTGLKTMADVAPDFMNNARFSTRFGRRFTYYDGFVFEICESETDSEQGRPFAAGGRYDRLLSDLSGGDVDASAVGAIIVPHRLKRAAGETL